MLQQSTRPSEPKTTFIRCLVPDNLDRLAQLIHSKLRGVRPAPPRASVLRRLLEIAYFATLRTEEGRFIRGSLTFADPNVPEPNPPIIRRSDHPNFAPLLQRRRLTVEALVKLSRAIDKWSGSIAVYGRAPSDIFTWGVVDQLVHQNVRLHREGTGGVPNLGILTIVMEGTGELSVYHGNLFLGSLRQDRLTTREFDALSSLQVLSKVVRGFTTAAAKIEAAIDDTTVEPHSIRQEILRQWSDTVARLCIGLRRIGTGGALLFSPAPHRNILDIKYEFVYNRLRDGFVLGVLDSAYLFTIEERVRRYAPKPVPSALVTLHDFADADADDRTAELAGAVRLVTSLAAVDGVVLLTPSLEVMAFGAKISAASTLGKVYDGRDFGQRGTRAITIDMSRFGTRHASVLQYCRADRNAIGVIVSQDGNV